jgi:hypothetical protein
VKATNNEVLPAPTRAVNRTLGYDRAGFGHALTTGRLAVTRLGTPWVTSPWGYGSMAGRAAEHPRRRVRWSYWSVNPIPALHVVTEESTYESPGGLEPA